MAGICDTTSLIEPSPHPTRDAEWHSCHGRHRTLSPGRLECAVYSPEGQPASRRLGCDSNGNLLRTWNGPLQCRRASTADARQGSFGWKAHSLFDRYTGTTPSVGRTDFARGRRSHGEFLAGPFDDC